MDTGLCAFTSVPPFEEFVFAFQLLHCHAVSDQHCYGFGYSFNNVLSMKVVDTCTCV